MADSMRASPPFPSTTFSHTSSNTTTNTSSAPDASINQADALKYWSSVSPTVNGMLGGFPQISRIDLQGSRNFVGKLIRMREREGGEGGMEGSGEGRAGKRRRVEADAVVEKGERTPDVDQEKEADVVGAVEEGEESRQQSQQTRYPKRTSTTTATSSNPSNPSKTTPPLLRAADCGAGIGRITHGLLLSLAQTVDIVEPVKQFTFEILHGEQFAPYRNPNSPSKIGEIYNTGLETWHPLPQTYDLIWNQWCLGQLTDTQLIAYLKRCGPALRNGGWVVVKENCSGGDDVFDDVDSSVTRSRGSFESLFDKAGMSVVATEVQRGFPKGLGLFEVRCWGLRPRSWKDHKA